ncbi:MAG: AAA family ATPase [Hyphomicrobiaceae bacterium]|nr:AAA family ATPase [Hyphomicrobiaceae bacterium]MCC0011226.1 AAA family ATPase [Hyphomicrobiaceae bacterium]
MSRIETSGIHREPSFAKTPPDVSDLFGIAKRVVPFAMIAGILALGSAIWLLSHFPPSYRTSTQLVLEDSVNEYLQSYKLTSGPGLGRDQYIQNFIVLSEDVLMPVIKKLNLINDPEFGCTSDIENSNDSATGFSFNPVTEAKKSLSWLMSVSGLKAPPPQTQKCDESVVFARLADKLSVWWVSNPSVIEISFESKDRSKAALIPNAIAESYINSTRENKQRAGTLAVNALRERLDEVKAQSADAERQLAKYQIQSGDGSSTARSVTNFQRDELSDQIAKARLAALDARILRDIVVQTKGSNNIPDNEHIIGLRRQYFELDTQAREMEARVGKKHAATVKLRDQMADISNAIADERKRIADSYATQFEFANSKYDELKSTVMQAVHNDADDNSDDIQLRQLESTAKTLRETYTTLSHRINEASRLERGELVLPFARVLRQAELPTKPTPSKKRVLFLAGSTFMGLALGLALALLKNNPLGVYRTTAQAKNSLGLISLIIPRVNKKKYSGQLTEYALDRPHSRFAETLRLIWSLMKAAQRSNKLQVVGVVTALAGEGKTTVAANLANQISTMAGKRTLLIDADFHHRSLTTAMAPQATHGLREALQNPDRLADFISRFERSGVDVLPCPVSEAVTDAAHLFGSNQMEDLLHRARQSYDLIIIEPPPIALVSDARLLAPLCDGFVFVIEWGKTSQRLVLETFSEFNELWERVLCIVLNKAEPTALRHIEQYKGSTYGDYFDDRTLHVTRSGAPRQITMSPTVATPSSNS